MLAKQHKQILDQASVKMSRDRTSSMNDFKTKTENVHFIHEKEGGREKNERNCKTDFQKRSQKTKMKTYLWFALNMLYA